MIDWDFMKMRTKMCKRTLSPAALALFFVGTASGCNAQNAPPATGLIEQEYPEDYSSATADNMPVREADKISINAAETACRAQEKEAFLETFIMSESVRKKYSAPMITYSVRQIFPVYHALKERRIAAADYHDFPIIMWDYYYKSARPVLAGDESEYVMWELNQSQANQLSVEWTRVHFDGQSEGGDDLGNAYTLDGQPYEKGSAQTDGQLLFEPSGECWQLVADIRHLRGEK